MLLKIAKGLLSMTSFTPFLSSKTGAPELSSTIIQNNNKKNCWVEARIFIAGFYCLWKHKATGSCKWCKEICHSWLPKDVGGGGGPGATVKLLRN